MVKGKVEEIRKGKGERKAQFMLSVKNDHSLVET